MSCNCEGKKYNISLGCCVPVLGPIEQYYTKYQIDKMLAEIESGITSGCCITPEEVDEKIDEATSGLQETLIAGDNITISGNVISASASTCDLSDYYNKEEVNNIITSAITDIESEIPSLSGYATEQWVLDKHYISGVDLSDYALKSEIPTVPTSNSAFTNDMGYLTEHQPLKTINGYTISGTGNIEITASGGSISVDSELSLESTNPVENKVITEALNDKLDASAYTPCDLSDYWTSAQTQSAITEATSGKLDASAYTPIDLSIYATTSWVNNQNYASNSELIQYITNLQNQIDSLTELISGCCSSSGETEYRWITMTGDNDYTCSGTTKYTKEKEQSSTDGINWADTGNYRSGDTVLEENCVDCGYVPSNAKGKIHFYRSDLSTNTRTTQCVTAFTDVSTSAYPRNYEFEISGDTICGLRGMTVNNEVVRSVCSVITPSTTRVISAFAFLGEAGGEPQYIASLDRNAVIALNEGLEEIGMQAFYYYVQDTNRLANGSIIIPSTVTSIGSEAFNLDGESFQSKNQYGLKIRFYFKSQIPPSMTNIFGSTGSQMNSVIRIYVPTGTTEAYRQALGYSTMEIVEYDGNITYMSDSWSHDNLLYQGLIQ